MTKKVGEMLAWAEKTFGAIARDPHERALRFIEESLELAQAVGLTREEAAAMIERVYSRPPGDVFKEAGQAKLTAETLYSVLGIKPWVAYDAECERVLAIPQEEWDRRHAAKKEKGLAL